MRIGIFIRSIGERTENLCFEAANQSIDSNSIHILKNYTPSYKVYKQMFKDAYKHKYDWFIGLDADVILVKDWFNIVTKEIERADSNTAKITFNIIDYITSSKLSRGVHLYNNKFNHVFQKELNKNIRATKLWPIYKLLNKSNYYTKPESSIHDRLKNYNLNIVFSDKTIGFHGFEQYYSEIYRQYLIRFNRDPKFVQTNNLAFLDHENQTDLYNQKNYDHFVANLGWNKGKELRINNVSSKLIIKINDDLSRNGVKEKEQIDMTLDEFYNKYGYMLLK